MGGPNILLAVHCKKSEPLDLKAPVLDYVLNTYGLKVSSRAAPLCRGALRSCATAMSQMHAAAADCAPANRLPARRAGR
jgi:hypothetical protein